MSERRWVMLETTLPPMFWKGMYVKDKMLFPVFRKEHCFFTGTFLFLYQQTGMRNQSQKEREQR